MSKLPDFSIRELLEAGVHYGHKTMRWNPRMAQYLFGSRNGTHIIDLQQTAPMLHSALQQVYNVVKNNGRVLFVGTKRQASEPIATAAKKCGQYFVNHRWLGGMLTNWNTVSASIKTLRNIEAQLEGDLAGLKKKEILQLNRKAEKLRKSLGGIMDMGGHPDLLFIVDVNKETLALKEANNLNVPVIGIVDSNASPEGVDFVIPGNDDATRAIQLYCDLIADAALAGIQESLGDAGIDVGSLEEVPLEEFGKQAKNDNKAKKAAAKTQDKKVADTKESKKEAIKYEAKKETAKTAAKTADDKETKKAPAAKAKKTEDKPSKKAEDKK